MRSVLKQLLYFFKYKVCFRCQFQPDLSCLNLHSLHTKAAIHVNLLLISGIKIFFPLFFPSLSEVCPSDSLSNVIWPPTAAVAFLQISDAKRVSWPKTTALTAFDEK